MLRLRFSRAAVSIFFVLAFAFQGTLALAGTTGTLSGVVTDSATKQPLAGAKISAASPSQLATATTDANGHFVILDLQPDTYTVSAQFGGYNASTITGVTVVADNTRELTIVAEKSLKTIGHVTSRGATTLVKSGVTADEYSVDPVQQAKVAVAGGGGNLDSAFSALATVPGVVIMPGQSGYVGAAATLSIRGGDYDQIGYEIDGVPVNRAFDNYPSGSTSSLGQQELQVYTGAPPANSTSEGISGYINQVIRGGTLPGFESITVADGGPAYYHKLAVEVGGASANRNFTYYAGIGGYDQQLRFYDQYNGTSLSRNYGTPVGTCYTTNAAGMPVLAVTQAQAPSCYTSSGVAYSQASAPLALGAFDLNGQSKVSTRDNILNFHYYIPHKDGSRDDLQALYENNYILTSTFSSSNDLGGVTSANTALGISSLNYTDGYQVKLPTGGFLPANYKQYAAQYFFPNTPTHAFDGVIDPNLQDGFSNNQSIAKVQYTKSLGSNAYARLYGYSYYSNWLITGPNSNAEFDGASNGDYELEAHTRGTSLSIVDQINSQNLLQFGADFTYSNVLRDNNTEYLNGASLQNPTTGAYPISNRTAFGVLVDSSNPTNGICYNASAAPVACLSGATGTGLNKKAGYVTLQQAYNGQIAPAPNAMCGAGPCQYLVIGNGQYATFNTVTPKFYGLSLTDEFKPTSKLTINGGLRLDDYQYVGSDTSGGNARAFFYNAYNHEECIDNTSKLVVSKLSAGAASINAACPTGTSAANFKNPSGAVTETYPVYQPRIGATYAFTPTTVVRAAYGRYAEPPNSAFEQYNTLQANAPATLYGTYGFQQYGYTSPDHAIPPATSNNYDFSIEHQFPHEVSIKLSPFYRTTQNQSENFFLNRVTNFVSGLNVGNQTSRGFEFEMDKGNFANNGLSAKLSFAYTNSTIKYNTLSNGSTVLTPIVDGINAYNAFTKKGGGSPCYLANGTAADMTAVGGTPDPSCAPATVDGVALAAVANPYYNAPPQSAAAYAAGSTSIPYDTIPAGIGLDAQQIGVPYVTSLVLNEKINKFAIAPVLQYFAGQRYGTPLASAGIDPTSCGATLAGTTAGDPRYNYGAAGGSPYDATSCGTLAGGIPNVQSGAFDGIGAYVEPSQLLLHLQLSYEATKNFTLTANLSNVVNTCFGGSKVPWSVAGACQYGLPTFAGVGYGAAGNQYNPGEPIQPGLKSAYGPIFNQQPFGIYVSGNLKL